MKSKFRLPALWIRGSTESSPSICTRYKLFVTLKALGFSVPVQHYRHITSDNLTADPLPHKTTEDTPTEDSALRVVDILKNHHLGPIVDIQQRLHECDLLLTEDLILNVLLRHRTDWKVAFAFFTWVCNERNTSGFCPDISIYNEILNTLGRLKRFDEFQHVLDEMSSRKILMNERTYGIVVSRFAAGRKVDEAIKYFNRIEDFGLERNLVAFQTLLLSLCRYKHVEQAELLFRIYRSEFGDDIKTWNIILNGWCVLRSLPDAKRFWKDIVTSECKPDKFSYGIFIHCLCKSGKVTSATNLLRTMWEKGYNADTTICNTLIDGLCFKQRIPEALQILSEMKERNCPPNAATYNSLIKYMCRIHRMETVDELLTEMEEKGGNCLPDALTYIYLLRTAKKPEEVDRILERMGKSGCKLDNDSYNLLLRLFMRWKHTERVKSIWDEMAMSGSGPDQRSYTVVIHGFHEKRMTAEAMSYYDEMISKGLVPEPRTKLLVNMMKDPVKQTRRGRKKDCLGATSDETLR